MIFAIVIHLMLFVGGAFSQSPTSTPSPTTTVTISNLVGFVLEVMNLLTINIRINSKIHVTVARHHVQHKLPAVLLLQLYVVISD